MSIAHFTRIIFRFVRRGLTGVRPTPESKWWRRGTKGEGGTAARRRLGRTNLTKEMTERIISGLDAAWCDECDGEHGHAALAKWWHLSFSLDTFKKQEGAFVWEKSQKISVQEGKYVYIFLNCCWKCWVTILTNARSKTVAGIKRNLKRKREKSHELLHLR